MDEGVGGEVTPLDAANGGHLQGKDNEYLRRPESCNMLESHEMQIPGEGFKEILDSSTKNIRNIGLYRNTPRPMEGSGVTVEELTVRNFGGSNLSIVGPSTSSGIVQTRQNQWQHLYQLGGGSGLRESGQRMTTGFEDMGYSSFPEFLAQKASHENPNEVVEELVHSDNMGIPGSAPGSIRTKIISKSGFSEFFVKNTLKGKGVILRGPAQDVSRIDPRDRNHPKSVAGTMAAPDAPRGPEAKIINPFSVNTKCKNGGDSCGGVNLREWLRTGRSQAKKIACLHIFRQIVELVDSSHSQGVSLQRLRPSYFELLDLNKVRYLGSPDKKEILLSMMSQALSQSEAQARKRVMEQSVFPSVGLSAKKQRFVQNTGVSRPWIQFPTSFRHEVANASQCTATGQQNAYNEFDESDLVKRHGTESKFGNPLVSNTREEMICGGEQLEDKWYTSPEETSGGGCTNFSNVYCLGVFLFELLSHFDSESALAAAMSDLRYRILPPNFLSENPKEAGFCLWLLHPEPLSRPTTRDILLSEVINELPDVCIEELSATIDQEDMESDLLMYFLGSLKEQKQKNVSKLVDELQCLEADIQDIDNRNRSRSKDYLPRSYLHPEPSVYDRKNAFVHGEPSTNALSQIPKESKLTESIGQLESAYFSMRAKLQIPVNDVTIRQDNDLLSFRENWNLTDKDEERKIPTDRVGVFFDGLCKYARYSRFEVCGVLRNGDFNNSSNFICSLSFDRDEDYFAAAGVSKKIKIFDFNALFNDSVDIHYPAIEMPNKSKLSCVCWNSYVKNYLASTDFDGIVKLWDVTTGQSFSQFNEHEKRAWSVDFSKVCPTKLASGSDDCTVKLWNINEPNCLGTISSVANICCVQFSSHSSYLLAFGSADYRTYCYDLRYGRTPWCVLSGHDKAVSYVKFLDSQTIVSASTDNTLKLWDLNKSTSTGSPNACSLTLSGHTNEKNFVGLSVADGYIACGSESNEVYAYHRSLPIPITSHKFGSIDSISGKETDDDNGQFVSSVCWRKKSEMVVAANSSGCIKVLKML